MWDPKEQVSKNRKLVWGCDEGLRGLEEIIFHDTWRSTGKGLGVNMQRDFLIQEKQFPNVPQGQGIEGVL